MYDHNLIYVIIFYFENAQFTHLIITFNFNIAYCIIDFKEDRNYLTWQKFSIRSAPLASLKCTYVFIQLGIIHSIIWTIVILIQAFSVPFYSSLLTTFFNYLEFYEQLFPTLYIVKLRKEFRDILQKDQDRHDYIVN